MCGCLLHMYENHIVTLELDSDRELGKAPSQWIPAKHPNIYWHSKALKTQSQSGPDKDFCTMHISFEK